MPPVVGSQRRGRDNLSLFSARPRGILDSESPMPHSSAEKRFPVAIEALLASVFELLKERGAAREIALLVNADAQGVQGSYDNWNGGTYGWRLRLAVDLGLFSRLSQDEREDAARVLKEVVSEFFAEFENDHFEAVLIVPKAVENVQWRNAAAAFIEGAGISNQGRVRSDNIASRQVDGLLFRSEPEIHLYRAFKSLGVTFAPLPVFIRGGASYTRLEPDFVVIKDGLVMIVEVDGDTYHQESPVDAHQRLAPLDHEGAKIERVRAAECETPEAAKACADRLLALLDKRSAQARR